MMYLVFQLYSADITAGNAAPHFRTENGGIIKLYQQTTGVTSATYIGGAGTTVTDLDTFDGYTIPQIHLCQSLAARLLKLEFLSLK